MREYYVGVDLHKRFCQIAVIDGRGEKVDERRINNDREVLSQYFSGLPKGNGGGCGVNVELVLAGGGVRLIFDS